MYKVIAMIALSATLAACSSADDTVVAEPEVTPDASVAIDEPEPAQNIADQLPIPPTLEGAIEAYTPLDMNFYNELPPVVAFFALWNEKVDVSWEELNTLEKTTYGKVMKDPTVEYGKLMCVNGTIYEIETDRSMSEPLYSGSMATDDMDIYRFTAVGSSGELVAESRAKFCGIVAAKFSFDNAIGGTTHAPYLFGMFDLSENR